jgi:hypoxanthine phosphoribosyltransferase
MKPAALEPLFSSQVIAQRIHELARQISKDYQGIRPVIIGVLKGSFIFLSDLVRQLTVDADIDFVQVSSYGSAQSSSGRCELKKDVSLDIAGRHIVIIDDIIDSGLTMSYLKQHFQQQALADVKICCLIDKQIRRTRAIPVDYSAFTIQDGFVVGYGLDCDEQYRGLPEIYRLSAS